MQLNGLRSEIELALLQFQLLLNTSNVYSPAGETKIRSAVTTDSSGLAGHPYLKIAEQEQSIAAAATKLEKSKLLPELTLAYANSSIQGFGADEKLYSAGDRFHAGQVGIGLPIFTGAQKAKIKAAQYYETLTSARYDQQSQLLRNQWESAYQKFTMQQQQLAYYETHGLENASGIISTSDKKFASGDINYLEWVMQTNQAIAVQANYLDALQQYNESVIELNYLTSNL
jgi:cobalt-zinc-cadmium resistance protein CzcA